jgi:nanoRNase/pAp phosphatase (c-di-AMP/oligoRNAs hydrolase)
MRSEEKDEKYNIYLTPERGAIDPRDFSFILAKFKYDLLIVIDTPDLEKLGKIYEKNADLFFEVPIVNIDHRSNNENFGQINLVDIISSSCSEIVYSILEKIDGAVMEKKIADCLLTGIISATDSFQKKNTTPKALLSAASLMDKGADQQEIVRWLYKTHPLHILKLWGRTMAKLKWDDEIKLVWAELGLDDFVQSRSNPADVNLILEKLQENYSDGKIFLIVFNDTLELYTAKIKIGDFETAMKLQAIFGGTLKRDILEFSIKSENVYTAGKYIFEKIKEITKLV